jgi:hypothetical protein
MMTHLQQRYFIAFGIFIIGLAASSGYARTPHTTRAKSTHAQPAQTQDTAKPSDAASAPVPADSAQPPAPKPRAGC